MRHENASHNQAKYPQVTDEIRLAAKDNQFVILGDTDHSSPTIRDFLKSPELVSAAQAAGVKHIFLEYPAVLQDEVDQLRRGEITKEGFAENVSDQFYGWFADEAEEIKHFTDMADFILDAQKSGIAVHFADVTDANQVFDVDEQLEKEFGKDAFAKFQDTTTHLLEAAGVASSDNPLSGLNLANELSPEQKEKMREAFNALPQDERENFSRISGRSLEILDENMNQTRFNDTQVTQHITSIAGADKSLIIYGAFHDHMRSLLSQAGLTNYTIDIVDPDSNGNPDGDSGKTKPDATADLVTGDVQKTNEPPPAPTVTAMNPKSASANPNIVAPQ